MQVIEEQVGASRAQERRNGNRDDHAFSNVDQLTIPCHKYQTYPIKQLNHRECCQKNHADNCGQGDIPDEGVEQIDQPDHGHSVQNLSSFTLASDVQVQNFS